MSWKLAGVGLAIALAGACGSRIHAAPLPSNATCRYCRMPITDGRFAAQIIAARTEPRFFDDIGCLRAELAQRARGTKWVSFVADHRTGAWVPAQAAVYTRVAALDTPMGSHLIAHASIPSRDEDPAATGGLPLTVAEVFNVARTPGR